MKYKCHLCPHKEYQSINDYNDHMKKIHGIVALDPETNRRLELRDCIKEVKKK